MSIIRKRKRRRQPIAKPGLVPVSKIRPSPENDSLYRPINLDDPDIIALADSFRQHGLREPVVITLDYFILSGHRRFAAAKLAGMVEIPCRVENIRRGDDRDNFIRLLREYNRQRTKTRAEVLREEIVSINPDDAHAELIEYRKAESAIYIPPLAMGEKKTRCAISPAKHEFLAACQKIVNELHEFWPISDRRIHYCLLNNPPLKHSSKRDSRYKNDPESYKNLADLLTRARIAGLIPFEAIGDETRPVMIWNVYDAIGDYMKAELNRMFRQSYRNLQLSQPNHIEILGEKNTVGATLEPIAAEYCIPMTTGRGFSSLAPRYHMFQRFQKSGKDNLILLIASDFDPAGESIAESFARSMRDDFGVANIHPIKFGLNHDQVEQYSLPAGQPAKKGPGYKDFVRRYGHTSYELEALPAADLQELLRSAIDGVMDHAAFDAEVEQEKLDAAYSCGIRRQVLRFMCDIGIESSEGSDDE